MQSTSPQPQGSLFSGGQPSAYPASPAQQQQQPFSQQQQPFSQQPIQQQQLYGSNQSPSNSAGFHSGQMPINPPSPVSMMQSAPAHPYHVGASPHAQAQPASSLFPHHMGHAAGVAFASTNNANQIRDDWYQNIKDNCRSLTHYNTNHPFFQLPYSPHCFSKWFNHYRAEQKKIGDKSFMHAMLASVMVHTLDACRQGSYTIEFSSSTGEPMQKTLDKNQFWALAKESTYYGRDFKFRFDPLAQPPYQTTTVEVISKDTANVGKDLLDQGLKPVILNMASPTSPGGGFIYGHWAQEESLTRRSNYYQHLSEFDQLCPPRPWRYPMEYQGGIYSRQVCFFRGTEKEGYPFLEEPFYLDCIAMAAFCKPPLAGNRLEAQAARRTKSKLKKIFLIAHERGHSVLVLGALGCGAFQNPPAHIAELFEEVIQEFAGWFSKIVFAVLDDHNSVHGNYQVFKRQFSKNHGVYTPNGTKSQGSWGSSTAGHHQPQSHHKGGKAKESSKSNIKESKQCMHGGLCKKLNDKDHCAKYSHPPLCADGGECTKLESEKHLKKYRHPPACRDGGLCPKRGDKRHLREYVHPSACPYKGMCTEMNQKHLAQHLHPIDCPDGDACTNTEDSHLIGFRHPKTPCNDAWSCGRVQAKDHMKRFSHKFHTPCRSFEKCDNQSPAHKNKYSHRCMWGGQCKDFQDKNAEHNRSYYHIFKPECELGERCRRVIDPDHLLKWSHPGIPDILKPCEKGEFCVDIMNLEHAAKFLHPKVHQFTCDVRGYNSMVDFWANRDGILRSIKIWNGNTELVPPPDIVHWVSQFRPIHRCKAEIFVLVLTHGSLLSSNFQEYLKQKPHNAISSGINSDAALKNIFLEYRVRMDKDVKPIIKMIAESAQKGTLKEDEAKIQSQAKNFPPGFLNAIHGRIKEFVHIVKTSDNKGIKYSVDKDMGTNKHIFSVVGPHYDKHYGDIVFVLSPDIMHHPDFNMTPHAATSYYSGRTFGMRPWLGEIKKEDLSKPIYESHKMNACVRDWPTVMATEIVAQFMFKNKMRMPTLDEVKNVYETQNSHFSIEGHLPSRVPLAYVRKVIMPQATWDALSAEVKEMFEWQFPKKFDRLLLANTIPPLPDVVVDSMVGHGSENIGFCFALSNNWAQPRVLPILPSQGSEVTVTFKAYGQGIFVTLSPDMNLDKAPAVYHIALADGKKYSTASIRKGLRKTDKVLQCVQDFNEGFDDRMSVPYQVTVKTTTGEVIVSHPSSPHSKSLVFRDKSPIKKLTHVAFGCWQHSVTFSDIIFS